MKKAVFIAIGLFTTAYFFISYYNESEFGISDASRMGTLTKLRTYFDDTELKEIRSIELKSGNARYYMDCRKGKPPSMWEFLVVISDSDDRVCAVMGTCFPNPMGGRTTVVSRFLAKYWNHVFTQNPQFIACRIQDAGQTLPPLPVHVAEEADETLRGKWMRVPAGTENVILSNPKGRSLMRELERKKPEKIQRPERSAIPLA